MFLLNKDDENIVKQLDGIFSVLGDFKVNYQGKYKTDWINYSEWKANILLLLNGFQQTDK